jgi:arylsulfatase A-like enzyme
MAKPPTPVSTFNILLLNPQWLNRKYAVERFSTAIFILFSFFKQNVKELALLLFSCLLLLLSGFQFSSKVLVTGSTVFAVVFAFYYIEVDHIPRRKGFIAAAPTLRRRIMFSLLPLVALVYLGAFVSVRSSFFYSLSLPIGAFLGIALNIGITKRAYGSDACKRERMRFLFFNGFNQECDDDYNEHIQDSNGAPTMKYIIQDELRNATRLAAKSTNIFEISSSYLGKKKLRHHVGVNQSWLLPKGSLRVCLLEKGHPEESIDIPAGYLREGWNIFEKRLLRSAEQGCRLKIENNLNIDVFFGFERLETFKQETSIKVVFVTFDGFVPETLGLYQDQGANDHISSFFSKPGSVIYKNAYSQGEYTNPALASVFTGCYSSKHGVNDPDIYAVPIPKEMQTIGEFFQKNQFKTFGHMSAKRFSPSYGSARGFDSFHFKQPAEKSAYHFQEAVNLARNEIENNPGSDQFIYLHTFETHWPLNPKPDNVSDLDYIESINKQGSDAQLINFKRLYAEKFKEVDKTLMHFFDYLSSLKNTRTIVVLSADHGVNAFDSVNANLTFSQQEYYLEESCIKVPLMIRDLSSTSPAESISLPVEAGTSILPSLAHLLELQKPDGIDGVSILPLADKGHKPGKGYAFSESIYKDRYELFLKTPNYSYLQKFTRDRQTGSVSPQKESERFLSTDASTLKCQAEFEINQLAQKEGLTIFPTS